MNEKKGFTLIELLVTVSIIAVLSGLLLGVINIQGIRQKARDSQRMADLKKVQVALEAYLADHRRYPVSVWTNTSSGLPQSKLTPNYLSNFPTDPSGSAGSDSNPFSNPTSLRYNYVSDGSRYILTAIMEVASSNDDSLCDSLSNWSYSGWGADISGTTWDKCYGVQNP